MIRLNRLYSQPETFDPIKFRDGINLILGERVKESEVRSRRDKKTNGVGKTMCIEFINFCFLCDTSNSRVMKIPLDKFPEETEVILELTIGNVDIVISRTKEHPDNPKIIVEQKVNEFSRVSDAREFILEILYNNGYKDLSSIPLSFREFLSPIIRDEDSEFKDIVNTQDLKKNIPYTQLVKSHLYYLGLNLSLFEEIKSLYKDLADQRDRRKKIEKRLTQNHTKNLSDVRSELNDLNAEIERVNTAIENLKTNEAYESIQDDINTIEEKLRNLRTEQKALRYEIQNISHFPSFEQIKTREIKILYDKFKQGLGTQLVKSLDEVIEFKKEIDFFQKSILKNKLEKLRKELDEVTRHIRDLEGDRVDKLKLVSSKGELDDYKNSQSILIDLVNKHSQVKTDLDNLDRLEREITRVEVERDKSFMKMEAEIFELRDFITSFLKNILAIHEYVMGNQNASFEIMIKKKRDKIIDFEYRIFDDGSRSVDRTKVFIYDIALLFNSEVSKRHPKFLIHDNIFDVDQDTLVQSLNYLAEQEAINTNFQYILTLNRDKIENEERRKEIKLDIDEHRVANFTKQKPFLKVEYQEI